MSPAVRPSSQARRSAKPAPHAPLPPAPSPRWHWRERLPHYWKLVRGDRPIGILLKVTPQVNSQGFIKLTIEPEVSSRAGITSFGGAGGADAGRRRRGNAVAGGAGRPGRAHCGCAAG